jgi:hypothetical protein
MTDLFRLILGILASRFKARATLEAENLVLRQQLNVLRRRTPKRPHLNTQQYGLFSICLALSLVSVRSWSRFHSSASASQYSISFLAAAAFARLIISKAANWFFEFMTLLRGRGTAG